LQELLADLQELCPLHEFTPVQCTFASSAAAVVIEATLKRSAAAVAIAAPETDLDINIVNSSYWLKIADEEQCSPTHLTCGKTGPRS